MYSTVFICGAAAIPLLQQIVNASYNLGLVSRYSFYMNFGLQRILWPVSAGLMGSDGRHLVMVGCGLVPVLAASDVCCSFGFSPKNLSEVSTTYNICNAKVPSNGRRLIALISF